MSVCSAEVGQRETLGPNDSPRIREYKRAIHSSFNYPVAWCAIFVTYTYTRAGLKPAGNEWVPSWSKDPRSVIYTRGAPRNQYPCPGDVVTFYYARLGYEGHIGLVKEWPPTGDYFYTIEGNTNNAGSREGDGVYVKMHRKSDAYKIMRFV